MSDRRKDPAKSFLAEVLPPQPTGLAVCTAIDVTPLVTDPDRADLSRARRRELWVIYGSIL